LTVVYDRFLFITCVTFSIHAQDEEKEKKDYGRIYGGIESNAQYYLDDEDLNFSQPAMTKMITRMKKKGYVESSVSGQDSRKKLISLSSKAKAELPKFERIWNAGQKSIQQVLESNMGFFKNLEDLENQIIQKSFKDRALDNLEND